MNWWWTVHECLFMWTFQELLMNCSWTIFFHNKFLNRSWTVMVNCSWTLVHEPTMRVFYELFMNCSWTFMKVHEQFIKSWTTFHRGYYDLYALNNKHPAFVMSSVRCGPVYVDICILKVHPSFTKSQVFSIRFLWLVQATSGVCDVIWSSGVCIHTCMPYLSYWSTRGMRHKILSPGLWSGLCDDLSYLSFQC